MHHLIFANAKLEREFRKVVDTPDEVGGYLFCDLGAIEGVHRGKLKSNYALPRWQGVAAIASWVLVPNISKTPYREWRPNVDSTALNQIANLSTRAGASFPLHFHTHPSGTINPSPADFEYWFQYCRWAETKKEVRSSGVIVGRQFFNWCIYDVGYDLTKGKPYPCHIKSTRRFFSWRDHGVKMSR